jgi:hypothetical protein
MRDPSLREDAKALRKAAAKATGAEMAADLLACAGDLEEFESLLEAGGNKPKMAEIVGPPKPPARR